MTQTRCEKCRTLNAADQANCTFCSALLSPIDGVDEAPRWNGKVRSEIERTSPPFSAARENFVQWFLIEEHLIVLGAALVLFLLTALTVLVMLFAW